MQINIRVLDLTQVNERASVIFLVRGASVTFRRVTTIQDSF